MPIYHVTLSVTRQEVYRIEANNIDEAERRAYGSDDCGDDAWGGDGSEFQAHLGETIRVDALLIEEERDGKMVVVRELD
jgi:hypothetical protein